MNSPQSPLCLNSPCLTNFRFFFKQFFHSNLSAIFVRRKRNISRSIEYAKAVDKETKQNETKKETTTNCDLILIECLNEQMHVVVCMF